MKPIKDLFLFKMCDKSSDLKKKMLNYEPRLDDLNLELIEDQMNTIQKRYNYPAKNIILPEVGNTIIPIYNKTRLSVPNYLPSYLMVNPQPNSAGTNKVIAIVNLNSYGIINKKTSLMDIDERKLFGLLQCGEIFLTCYRRWNSITMNQTMCKLGSLIYSRMIVKVLDKMYAVNLDPIKADKVKFVASKFFLVNMLEKNSGAETINNMAYANCTNGTSRNTINKFNEDFNPAAYANFGNFIQQLSMEIDGMANLTVRTFLDTALKLYGSATLFAYEYLPMFLHTVFSVVIGCRFNQDFVLENILGREADQLYNTFVGLMR